MPSNGSASVSSLPRSRQRVGDAVAVAAILILVSLFYIWIASPEAWPASDGTFAGSYYNQLVEGFRAGHLSLKHEVPAGLLALKDPYDPVANTPYRLHDASYFNGHYYIYFGAAPAVVLYWPYLALTGRYLSDVQVTSFFAFAGLACALWLLLQVRWRFFPEIARAHLVGAALAVGLCTMLPSLMCRVAMWEVPIVAAFGFGMLSLVCLYYALYGRRRIAALALASLAYGFAIGSRPTYAFGATALWVPVYLGWSAVEPLRRLRHRLALVTAVVVPIGAVVLGILIYNQQRFANPLEFGEHYQMSGANEHAVTHFGPAFFLYNLRVYLFAPARLSPYFPFVRVINAPPPPVGFLGMEDPYGALVNIPITLFIIGLAVGWRRLGALRPLVVAVGIFFTFVMVTVCCFGGSTNRYMVEFMPAWILLASIGFLWLASVLRGRVGRAVRTLWTAGLAVSCGFNVFAALGHNELLHVLHPKVYASLAHAFNWPSYWAALATHTHFRPLNLTVKFPQDATNHLQPLLVSGVGFLSDYLYLYYPSKNTVIIGYEHTSGGGPHTPPISLDFNVPHVITIEAGFLYPPLDHPYFDRMTPHQAREHKTQLGIRVDGVSYLQMTVPSYDPTGFAPLVGVSSPDRNAFGPAFTGTILKREFANPPPLIQAAGGGSPISIGLTLPPFAGVRSEPLVTTGAQGAGDNLFVTYVDPTHITIGLDHWGYGGPTSAPIAVQYDAVQVLVVSLGSFYSSSNRPAAVAATEWARQSRRLEVSLNGQKVFAVAQDFFEAEPSQIEVGMNFIGSSASAAEFAGKIVSQAPVVRVHE